MKRGETMKTEIFVKVTNEDGGEWTHSWLDDGDISVGIMEDSRDPLRILRKITKRIEYRETAEAQANAEKNEFARDLSLIYKALTTVGVRTDDGELTANKELLHGFLLAKGLASEREEVLLVAAVNAGNLVDEGEAWRMKKW
jgi:hypothetical protein